MSLEALTKQSEIRNAFDTYIRNLNRGIKGSVRKLGFQGGSPWCTVRWMPGLDYWSVTESPWSNLNRFWCAYGVQSAAESGTLEIACEIKAPKKGRNLQCAGLFVRDVRGRVFLAHTGKIGGSQKGVGKSAFLDFCDGVNLQDIVWPDGDVTQAIVIGRIDGPAIRQQVGEFVKQVADFKGWNREHHGEVKPSEESEYFDEFMGKRRSYRGGSDIESMCDHGFIVRDLRKALEGLGVDKKSIKKDMPRDLFVSRDGRPVLLFEAKTDVSLQSLYAGLGQLMLHGAAEKIAPARVLVVPESPSDQTMRRLKSLQVEVVTFDFDGRSATFQGLRRIVESVGS